MVHALFVGLAECRHATVSTIRLRPKQVAVEDPSAVAQAAADRDVGIGGMEANALKLHGLKVSIQVAPGRNRRVIQAVNSSTVPIQEFADGIAGDGVMIDVRRGAMRPAAKADVGPVHTAVCGPENALLPTGLAPGRI